MKIIDGGECIAQTLEILGFSTAFTLVGNQISPVLVNLESKKIEVIGVCHEQAAIHMADAWAQVRRDVGLAIVSGGPGLTNSLTGIIKAYFAQTPMLIIIGSSVPAQNNCGGLQDMDQLTLIKPFSKWAATIYDAKRIPEYLFKAKQLAFTGERGPVVLEIPLDVMKAEINSTDILNIPVLPMNRYCHVETIEALNYELLFELLSGAKRPVVILGDEVYYSFAEKEVLDFVEAISIPTYTVNKARGIISDEHYLCFGNGRVLEAGPSLFSLKNSDLIITIGIDFDYQMNFLNSSVCSINCKRIHITNNFDKTLKNYRDLDELIIGDIKLILDSIAKEYSKTNMEYDFSEWFQEIRINNDLYWCDLKKISLEENKNHPLSLIEQLDDLLPHDSIIVLDGSNAMFWGGLLFKARFPGQVIIAPDGTLGPMGTGVSLAIGAKVAAPEKTVLLYTGDGSFGFGAMEIATAVFYNYPIKIVIHNDGSWGFCESTQKEIYDRCSTTTIPYIEYDKLTEALGGIGCSSNSYSNGFMPDISKLIESKRTASINVSFDRELLSPGSINFNKSLKKMK